MKTFIFITIFLLLVIILTPADRYIKTFYLILSTTPYERFIEGAPKILVLGDSTGYGTGVMNNEYSVAGLIASDYPEYTIENISVNGRTIEGLLKEIKSVSSDYKMILLQIGGNDILRERDVDEVESELREIVSKLTKHTDHLIMISTGNVGGASSFGPKKSAKYTQITRDFRDMFNVVGTSTPLTYVDLFLEPEEDVMSNNPDTYLSVDGIHPGKEGYALWYSVLKPEIDKVLND